MARRYSSPFTVLFKVAKSACPVPSDGAFKKKLEKYAPVFAKSNRIVSLASSRYSSRAPFCLHLAHICPFKRASRKRRLTIRCKLTLHRLLAPCIVELLARHTHYSVRIGISPPVSHLYWPRLAAKAPNRAHWCGRFLHGAHTALAIRCELANRRPQAHKVVRTPQAPRITRRPQSCAPAVVGGSRSSAAPHAGRARYPLTIRCELQHYQPLLEPSPNSRSERSEALRSRLFFLLRLMSSLYSGM